MLFRHKSFILGSSRAVLVNRERIEDKSDYGWMTRHLVFLFHRQRLLMRHLAFSVYQSKAIMSHSSIKKLFCNL